MHMARGVEVVSRESGVDGRDAAEGSGDGESRERSGVEERGGWAGCSGVEWRW